nr:methylated-dna--protein-cysteine methyltransferase [Quercus suber]
MSSSTLQDPAKVTPYQSRVYALLEQIPAGHVSTYAALSRALGSSPRAVGGALRRNPFAPRVPCHRVISAGGVSLIPFLSLSPRFGGYVVHVLTMRGAGSMWAGSWATGEKRRAGSTASGNWRCWRARACGSMIGGCCWRRRGCGMSFASRARRRVLDKRRLDGGETRSRRLRRERIGATRALLAWPVDGRSPVPE